MDRNQALEKIAKCLALGKSPNEHEAAAAMRQAQKLMVAYGISERELGIIGYAKETVFTTIQSGKKIPIVLAAVTGLISTAFGVKTVYGRSVRVTDEAFDVHYFGPEHRVLLAGYAHAVVQRAVDEAWKTHLKDHPWVKGKVGARSGFVLGWIHGVKETVEDFAWTDEEARGTELLKQEVYGRELAKSKTSKHSMDGHAYISGGSASEGFALHRPVTSERLKINA